MLVENQLIKECRNRVNVSSVHIFCVYSWPSMVPRVPSIPSLFGPRVLSNPKFKFELHLLSETARRWPQRSRHKDHSKLSLNAFAFFHTWKSKDKMWIANDCSCIVIWRPSQITTNSKVSRQKCVPHPGPVTHFVDMVKCFWSLHLNVFFIYAEVCIQRTWTWLHHFSVSVYLWVYCNVAYCSAVECKAVQWNSVYCVVV